MVLKQILPPAAGTAQRCFLKSTRSKCSSQASKSEALQSQTPRLLLAKVNVHFAFIRGVVAQHGFGACVKFRESNFFIREEWQFPDKGTLINGTVAPVGALGDHS